MTEPAWLIRTPTSVHYVSQAEAERIASSILPRRPSEGPRPMSEDEQLPAAERARRRAQR
jgi:hypothetical protein